MPRALLIVDMLNDFVTGKFGFQGAKRIVPRLKEFLEEWRKGGEPVIYVCDSHPPEDGEFALWGPHAVKGTEGARVIPELEPKPGEKMVEKRRYSGFFETELEKVLKEKGVEEVVLTGVLTDFCILHTAADAFFRGYRVTVLRDCVASTSQKAHHWALKYMRKAYGARITSSKKLLEGKG
ncbi:MAG: isochorismatase family cysteine hydrolase [Candidatus Hadarchaeales archaeon]|nr:MAG: cysteine hydrolase [Hadesarchaea archaeon]